MEAVNEGAVERKRTREAQGKRHMSRPIRGGERTPAVVGFRQDLAALGEKRAKKKACITNIINQGSEVASDNHGHAHGCHFNFSSFSLILVSV